MCQTGPLPEEQTSDDSRHMAIFRNPALIQNYEIATFAYSKKHYEVSGFRFHFNEAFQKRRSIQV